MLLAPSLLTQTPDLAPLILTLPSNLIALLERPQLLAPRSRAFLHSLTEHLQPFLDALYAPELDDLSNAVYDDLETTSSPFLAILNSAAVKGTSPSVQTSLLLYLLARSTIPHTLAPWSILQLLTPNTPQSKYLSEARDIAKGKVSVTQDPGIGAIKPPPDVTITTGTATVLSAVVAETTMLYARGWSEFEAQRDVTVSESIDQQAQPTLATLLAAEEKGSEATEPLQQPPPPVVQKWLFRKGQRLVAAHWLAGEGDEVWNHGKDGYEQAIALALERRELCFLPFSSPLPTQPNPKYCPNAPFFCMHSWPLPHAAAVAIVCRALPGIHRWLAASVRDRACGSCRLEERLEDSGDGLCTWCGAAQGGCKSADSEEGGLWGEETRIDSRSRREPRVVCMITGLGN